MIRVIVADDQQVVREGLVALLDLLDDVTVVGSAADGRQALDVLRATPADVVLMDLRMPELDGVAATRMITRDHPGTAVLVLTTYADDSSIADALRAGARGYLTKDAGRAQIAMALRSTAAGQSTFDAKVSERLVAALDGRPRVKQEPPDGLTARETEVLGLITRGLTNPEIAAELFISEATVKTHINNVFAKIGVRHRAEAVRYGLEHDL
nr:response regulator transcription factor [Kibdelosporangium sp. MJ126-NF4]CEL20144.1 two-component system response regulator [Kibdelosporangium sp. MJ126-NF4]CTQ97369.1 two-component system response regulator [Kibdelosporangium sp. MJ126-NF4]